MSDASDLDDIEAIKERKKEELLSRATADGSNRVDGAPDEPIHVGDADHLTEIVADHDVVLVDFYADWCGPCQMLEPAVEAVAAETAAAVAKVDIDALQGLAREYDVRGVPTLYLFAGGEAVERLVGMQDQSTLFDLVEQYA